MAARRLLEDLAAGIEPADAETYVHILERFTSLAVPPNALGRLVDPIARLAAAQHSPDPLVAPAACVVFVADHGIARDDTVTPWPQMVTRTVADIAAQGRAACAAIARSVGADLVIVDVGIATGPTPAGVLDRRVRDGSDDVRTSAGISTEDVHSACHVGVDIADQLIGQGSRVLAVGEIGIGNTTAAAAVISLLCHSDPMVVTGRGSGIDDSTLERKRTIVGSLVDRCHGRPIVGVLAEIGALEICALAGLIVGAAKRRTPVVLDGVTTLAAGLVAREISAQAVGYLIAGHRSPEPAVDVALATLGLDPLVDFGLRVGEGTGALLSLPILAAGCEILTGVARLDEVT